MNKRVIAYYLPQFHPIKENDLWWGEGYTEWRALESWKPYFKNHQLRKPTKLGYYDLRNPEVLESHYALASSYGIEGFCFWTYWFGAGERLLEKPLEHLLLPTSKVKYSLAWANHSWFDKSKWRLLQEQKYLGKEDYVQFYETMAPHFKNPNYIKQGNKPLFTLFMPQDIPDITLFMDTWNTLAQKDGMDGFYFISDQCTQTLREKNLFDAYMHSPALFGKRTFLEKILERLIRYHSWTYFGPMKYSYPKMMSGMYKNFAHLDDFIPTIFSGWDTTPRHAKRGVVMQDFTLDSFSWHVQEVFNLPSKDAFVFIKSWNEWAEGNILEPDTLFGERLLEIIQKANSAP